MTRRGRSSGLLGAFNRLVGGSVVATALLGVVASLVLIVLTYDAPRGGPPSYFPAVAGAVAGWSASDSTTRATVAGALGGFVTFAIVWLLDPTLAGFAVFSALAERGPLFLAGPGTVYAACLGGIGGYLGIVITS